MQTEFIALPVFISVNSGLQQFKGNAKTAGEFSI